MSYNLAQIQSLLRQTGWPENLIAKMAAIVMYESGGNPNAHNTNGEDSRGLLQIYTTVHPEYDRSRLYEPVYNLTVALDLYHRQGVNAWFNSNRKYNQNFQGIAAQSRAIYDGGNGDTTVITDPQQIYDMANNSQSNSGSQIDSTSIFIVALFGLGALVIFNRY